MQPEQGSRAGWCLPVKRRLTGAQSFAGLALLVSAMTGCKTPAHDTAAPPVSVPVATVSRANLSNDLTLTAEFTPYQNVELMSKVAGFVRSIHVDIGDHVVRGQILAVLEAPELQDDLAKANAAVLAAQAGVTTASSAIAQAQASANIAHLSFTRIEGVNKAEPGLVPRQDIDLAQAHDLEAAASLASAQSGLTAAKQRSAQAVAERDGAASMLQYATIRAPFDGVITKRYADNGSLIQAGTASQTQAMPVVQLAQDNVLRLTLPVPVADVAGVHVGEQVDIQVVSLGKTFTGSIAREADSVQMSTRTMDVEVDVPNPGRTLVPGMYAEAHLHLAARPDVLSVPLDAVGGLGTAVQQVYRVRNGHIAIVPVTVGIQTPDRVEITSGLQQGDVLVVGRQSGLYDGEPVDPHTAAYETQSANSK